MLGFGHFLSTGTTPLQGAEFVDIIDSSIDGIGTLRNTCIA